MPPLTRTTRSPRPGALRDRTPPRRKSAMQHKAGPDPSPPSDGSPRRMLQAPPAHPRSNHGVAPFPFHRQVVVGMPAARSWVPSGGKWYITGRTGGMASRHRRRADHRPLSSSLDIVATWTAVTVAPPPSAASTRAKRINLTRTPSGSWTRTRASSSWTGAHRALAHSRYCAGHRGQPPRAAARRRAAADCPP